MVSKNVSDSGVGTDALHVRKDECTISELAPAGGITQSYPWQHSMVILPDAIGVLVSHYGAGVTSVRFYYSADGGTSWTLMSFTIPTRDPYSIRISAVADTCTQDIHFVYGMVDDPVLSEEAENSIRYRKLTYAGSPGLPSWILGDEVEVATGGAGIGYSTPVLAVQRRGCGIAGSVDEGDGRLILMCLRRTFTTRTWALFTANAPWTLQGAAETPAAIPTASGSDRAGLCLVANRAYVLTYAGGVYALYRSGELDWGTDDAEFVALDSFSGDTATSPDPGETWYTEGFALASDILESGTDQGSYVEATIQIAASYIKDSQVHIRQWYVPVTGDATVSDQMIWPIKYAYESCISRVGSTFRVTAIVSVPDDTKRAVIYSDGPLYNAWFALGEDPADEHWGWVVTPEHATSGKDWAAAWLSAQALVFGFGELFVGRCPLVVYQVVNDVGAGDDIALLTIPLTDTGSGADAIALTVSVVDTGSGAELITILLNLEDEGVGSEVVLKGHVVLDSGVGTDLVALAMAMIDSGAGTDLIELTIHVADAGSGTDAIVLSPLISVEDSGVGTDAITELVVHVTDAGSGTDVPMIGVLFTDTGAGTELVSIILNVADEGVGSEVVSMLYELADSASGDDVIGLLLPLTDTGSGAEQVKIILNLTDTGVGSDLASMSVRVALLALRLLVAKGVLRLNVKGPGL